MKRIAVLGSTGSIGTSCCDVVGAHPSSMQIVALATRSRWEDMAAQCWRFKPALAAIADPGLKPKIPSGVFPPETELAFGPGAVIRAATLPEADVVVSGIVGAAGLHGTWAAVEAGKRVA